MWAMAILGTQGNICPLLYHALLLRHGPCKLITNYINNANIQETSHESPLSLQNY